MARKIVLITSPSLDFKSNVSGISSVIRNITGFFGGHIRFVHLKVGKLDKSSRVVGLISAAYDVLNALIRISIYRKSAILHLNLALNRKAIWRDFPLVFFARLLGIPILLHLHGGEFLDKKADGILGKITEYYFFSAKKIIALSSIEVQIVQRLYLVPKDRITYMYNSVRVEKILSRNYSPIGHLSILFAGRLIEEKGVSVILKLIEANLHGVEIRIAGQGTMLDEVQRVCAKSENAKYLGVLKESELRDAMRASDVLLLPSRSGEGMPMVIVEGMSEGIVPICTAMASIPEIIFDGRTGLFIAADDLSGVIDKIKLLRDDLDRRREMSFSAREFAVNNFERSHALKELSAAYSELGDF